MKIIYLINLINLGFGICQAHMFMSNPPSRKNKYSPYYLSNGLVDYNIMSPLNVAPYIFPCKGFTEGPSTATINSNSVSVTLEGTAIHGGGHCQFGISYNDKDFLVLKTVLYTCLLDSLTYTFDLPSGTPNGRVTVFWTWINKIGNREYYMECADVNINNEINEFGNVLKGKELLVVNLPGYPTVPEWGSSTDPSITGEKLLSERKDFSIVASPKTIVTASESTTESTTKSTTESTTESTTKSTTKSTTESTTESTTKSTTTTTESTTTTTESTISTTGGCKNGEMRCLNSGFETCVNSIWVYRECGVGTYCRQFLRTYIICDFIKD